MRRARCKPLERTQPLLPMGFGYVEGVTHDYKRHGTTTLFAALDVLTGQVLAQCKPRHRHQEFLGFLRASTAAVPPDLGRSPDRGQLPHAQACQGQGLVGARPRWHLHFVPTYSSWLNLVERFFALITDKAIRRGSFRCAELISAQSIASWSITTSIANPSSGPRPPIRSSPSSKDFVHESATTALRKATAIVIKLGQLHDHNKRNRVLRFPALRWTSN